MFLKNKALYVAMGIISAFAVGFHFIPFDRFKLYLDAGRAGTWFVVWVISIHLAMTAFFAVRRGQGQVVAIALNLAALVILYQAIWIPASREFAAYIPKRLDELGDAVAVLGFIVSGAFFLLPIGNTIGVTPPRNWWFLMGALVSGALFMGVMIGLGLQVLPS